MYKDIEYERNGVKKFASERFKTALISEGWKIVEDKKPRRKNKADGDSKENN